MIQKIFSSQSQTITGAAIILGAASLFSRLIGIIRDRIFAHYFGASDLLDAYYAAFRIPDFVFYLLIVGALSAGFIPVFTSLWQKDKEEAWKITNAMMHILGLCLLVLCGSLFFLAPVLMRYLVPGFSEENIHLASRLTRIMLLSPFFLGISSVASGALQSLKHFFIYSLTPVMYNLGIILGAIFLYPIFGPSGLAFGVVIGALLHLIIQVPVLYQQGFRYRALFLWNNPSVKKIGKLMIPRTLGLAANQINLVIIVMLASTLGEGSIAIYQFADNLQAAPIGVIGISFALAAFPLLSEFSAKNEKEKMIHYLSETIRQILFFIIPITVLFLLLRAQIVRVVLGTGQFDWTATVTTADALAFFALSLFAQCLIPLLARGFYALHNTWIPFTVGMTTTVVSIVMSVFFKALFGLPGLALAYSLAMMVQLVLLWVSLHFVLGNLDEVRMMRTLSKLSVAAIGMAVVVQFLKAPLAAMVDMTRFWGIFVQGFVAGAAGLCLYGFICYALRLEEMERFHKSLKRRWLKMRSIQPDIAETGR